MKPVFAILLSVSAAVHAAPSSAVMPFLNDHCVRCHGEEKQKGDFRIDTLSGDFTVSANAELWAEVMGRLNAAEMPPEDEPQPTAAELEPAIDWITTRLAEGEEARMAKRGEVAHYRLSRDEYAATIYDLLGVRFDVYQPGAMNEDPRWHGFERVGSMLSLSPSHVDRYYEAGEEILLRAFPKGKTRSKVVRSDAISLRHHNQREELEARGIADRVRALLWPGQKVSARNGVPRNVPGQYRARIQLSGLTSVDGIAPHLTVWDPKLGRSVFERDVVAAEGEPIIIEFEAFLTASTNLVLENEVAGKIPDGHYKNVLRGGGSVFTDSKEVKEQLNPTGLMLTTDDGRGVYPLMIVDWIEWEGPITTDADLAKREGLMPEFPKNSEAKEQIESSRAALRRFAARAWRRPVSEEEVERYVGVFRSELEAGSEPRSAQLAAMLGILTSKNFYYIVEGGDGRGPELNDHELATRLSYFLWGSMPDDTLLAAAEAGTLRDRDQLHQQLKRLLADPKIERFAESFPQQWMQLHRVGMFAPDSKLYPDYDLWLEKSMILESTKFFAEVFGKDLPVTTFLDSDWTMLNPRLARHYEIPFHEKSGFHRVSLRPEDRRGGLLTHSSVLSLTSDGTRHRPIHRGVWVSEVIYGITPTPPPPNVEPLEPTAKNQLKTTIRRQIEAHATDRNCASCHKKLDPLGFAFENYDAIGRWRTEETVAEGKGDNPPVDAAGTLPDGRKFSGAEEFQELLAAEPEPFVEAFVANLATFALRRTLTIDDRKEIKAIAERSSGSGYRIGDLIRNLVLSDLFLTR